MFFIELSTRYFEPSSEYKYLHVYVHCLSFVAVTKNKKRRHKNMKKHVDKTGFFMLIEHQLVKNQSDPLNA